MGESEDFFNLTNENKGINQEKWKSSRRKKVTQEDLKNSILKKPSYNDTPEEKQKSDCLARLYNKERKRLREQTAKKKRRN